ncbi:hypothetical protein QFZ24_010061 [Streptomyces phaeochromogenes]|uniref:hypothetical protein n=1 Tax=Streptomyces phaeochromogenes TaxID=1923 RepID=UPI00278E6C12|nr:hypothetical protein [Streptomyces phaeochromogenes]MDQ0956052.1 hypothetical protein [Streptomyces phaeochromogenes]
MTMTELGAEEVFTLAQSETNEEPLPFDFHLELLAEIARARRAAQDGEDQVGFDAESRPGRRGWQAACRQSTSSLAGDGRRTPSTSAGSAARNSRQVLGFSAPGVRMPQVCVRIAQLCIRNGLWPERSHPIPPDGYNS